MCPWWRTARPSACSSSGLYRDCRHLLLPRVVIAVQSGAPFYQPQQLKGVCDRLASSFAGVRPSLAPVPTYAGGMLALVAAGESHKAVCPSIKILRERFQRLRPDTRYYTPEVQWAAFRLSPGFKPVSAHREASTEGKPLNMAPDAARTAA
jgi:spermidine synthase